MGKTVNDRCWAALWRSRNKLDGEISHLMTVHCVPVLFRTARATTEWIREHYGYIATRKDLRAEPYGWRMPIPVRVEITVNSGSKK
jgi:hypothetical protein